ncbi:hypothetical protein KP803_00755 [Vibrio sp. ZSDE26]|uniref:Uncharacterized protein n=1 Tax=Vibrio amylolyticus TaxID=2847292 RepID=A0A9X1XEZ8_9VIBR|nr:hypothetical protein [Vibrio amylolyticus]MCK6261797.1 hypothetical protein [Vibrio amylolyticus]
MLWETLERVNRLRQEALSNQAFVDSAKEHEQALQENDGLETNKRRRKKARTKSLSQVYEQSEFGFNPSGVEH